VAMSNVNKLDFEPEEGEEEMEEEVDQGSDEEMEEESGEEEMARIRKHREIGRSGNRVIGKSGE
jgi:hypothetical protein